MRKNKGKSEVTNESDKVTEHVVKIARCHKVA